MSLFAFALGRDFSRQILALGLIPPKQRMYLLTYKGFPEASNKYVEEAALRKDPDADWEPSAAMSLISAPFRIMAPLPKSLDPNTARAERAQEVAAIVQANPDMFREMRMQFLFGSYLQVLRPLLAHRFRPWSPKHITNGGRIVVRIHFAEECIPTLESKLPSALIAGHGWRRAQFEQIDALNELLGVGWHTRTMPKTDTVLTAEAGVDAPISVGWHKLRGSLIGELVVSFFMKAAASERDKLAMQAQLAAAQAELAAYEAEQNAADDGLD